MSDCQETIEVTNIPELMSAYGTIAERMGNFVFIGVPISPGQNINYKAAMWLNKMVARPNVIAKYGIYKFAAQAWNETCEMVLEKWPFITHILLTAADEFPVDPAALDYMLALDKDVVAAPTPIVKKHRGVCWNVATDANLEHINYIRWGDLPKEPFPCAFACNPWLIKRKVIEKMEWPYFEDQFKKSGGRKIGQDIYFSQKVRDTGFELWAEPRAKFEHHRNVDLNFIMQEYFNGGPYDLTWGGFAIDKDDWEIIEIIIKQESKDNPDYRVLEFGSGLSSLLMSELVKVDSFEMLEKHKDLISYKNSKREVKDNLKIHMWDGLHFPKTDKKWNLAFVDGPIGIASGGLGRRFSIKAAVEHCDNVIIRDYDRKNEEVLQKEFLEPDFNLIKTYNKCSIWVRK